ncbi:MAG TPA: hypothetical protein PK775_09145, partial [Rectinema sp.]|nr:hypothetical protein [Rectinema sp.]
MNIIAIMMAMSSESYQKSSKPLFRTGAVESGIQSQRNWFPALRLLESFAQPHKTANLVWRKPVFSIINYFL